MTRYYEALDALERGTAAVCIAGVTLPVVGIGRTDEGQAVVDVAIGDEFVEFELNHEVRFIDLDEECDSAFERARRG